MPISQPTKAPPPITAATWHSTNANDILRFLVSIQGVFLYYKVLGVDPNPEASTAQEEEAMSVDVITRRQRKEFLAQERLVFDESIGSAFKAEEPPEPPEPPERQASSTSPPESVRKYRARVARTAIKYSKAPSGVYGMQELQMALYELLCTMAAPNYSSTVGGVSPTSPTCGTDLLRLLNAAISPTGSITNKNAKRAYDTHKDSFTDKTNFMTWWPMLLILQATKFNLGISNSTRIDAVHDACETIESNTGTHKRWGLEVMSWKMSYAAKRVSKEMSDEDEVQSFEHHMRTYQQTDDSSKHKEHANAANANANASREKPYCNWCFKEKGVKWAHSEDNCNNKKRAEGARGDTGNRIKRGACAACQSTEHYVKDCPLVAKVRALKAEATDATDAPSPRLSPRRQAAALSSMPLQALLSAAVIASSAMPTNAYFDTACTATMTPVPDFLTGKLPSNVSIEVANGSELRNNERGTFQAHCKDGPLPTFDRAFTNPALTATLVSGTQAVYTAQPKQDVVLSEKHGTFMQPTSDACPVCNQHEDRINFKGGPDGFTLDLTPGLQPASSFRATENLAQQPRNSSPLYRAIFAAPVELPPSSLAEPAAKELPEPAAKELPVLSAPQQLELLLAQPGATCDSPPPTKTSPRAKPAAPFLSDAAAARVKFLHTCFGGALTANNLADFMLTYPEYSEQIRIPKTLMNRTAAKRLLPPCHCCDRTKLRKCNAPPASTSTPAPLAEVHLDLFTYPNDPRYDAFFIDRATRCCWHYVLSKKSDLPKVVQQFIIDANTLTDAPVGSIFYSIESDKKYGIDAAAVNDYLAARSRPQRLRVLYTDGAAESASAGFEEFLADLNVQHLMSIPESQHQNGLAEHGGGVKLVNMIRHDLDLSGLGPSFRRYCASLNTQRMNHVPHRALNGKTPASVLFPNKSLPFRHFPSFWMQSQRLEGGRRAKRKQA